MSNNNEQSETLNVTPQGETPTTNPSGETPTPQAEKPISQNASRDELLSENARLVTRIGELNGECRDHRLDAKKAIERVATLEGELATYKSFGTTEEIKALQEKATRADELEREKVFSEAAGLAKYDAEELLDLATTKGFEVSIVERETDGKKTKVAMVGEKPLTDYVSENYPKKLPSLVLPEQQTSRGGAWGAQPSGNEAPKVPVDLVGQTMGSIFKRPDVK